MTTLLDYLAFFACLFTGIWLWRQFRSLGAGSLLAAALSLVVLWLVGGLLATLVCSVMQETARLLGATGSLLIGLAVVGVVALVGLVGWWLWAHWRARQFFDL